MAQETKDGDGNTLHEGDRVFSFDLNGRCYGTIHKNVDYPDASEWYINYDDGEECAVLEIKLVFKA